MDNLYIEIYSQPEKQFDVSLESLIVIFVYKHCNSLLNLKFIVKEQPNNEPTFKIDLNYISHYEVIKHVPNLATYCVLPLAIIDNVIVVSGLCSVARQIIKSSPDRDDIKKLLGFREACLKACNESSIWTKFCEIDMIHSIKDLLMNPKEYFMNDGTKIPKDLSRFEYHMSQPVRIHNMYKVAQDQARLKERNIKIPEINNKTPKTVLDLNHVYGEGLFMTLADVLLFPCIYTFTKLFDKQIFEKHFPLVFKWYTNMTSLVDIFDFTIPVMHSNTSLHEGMYIKEEPIEKTSLYVSDPQRYKPKNRIFTKQLDIDNAMNIVIKELNVKMMIGEMPYGTDVSFDWSKVPLEANPKGGALPASRMKRKSEQLENLAKAVMKIAKPGQTIVDFCSGSGHLGILLAVHLKECHVILLDNKEKSLARAKERVFNLNLSNITLLQCNLDYFQSSFHIGTSLHACGVATDLVIQHCLRQNAAFICCPCCYGNVQNYHHITYPRSKIFKNSTLTLKDYLVLGHAADQTHDAENLKTKQGIECMNTIDTDRKLQAEELGYKVFLSKMIPKTCTPKNNILVGIPENLFKLT